MGFGVGKAEGAAPRAAEHQPAFDVESLPQKLDVLDQIVGCVSREVGGRVARVRTAPSAVALIEQHDPVFAWVEESAEVG